MNVQVGPYRADDAFVVIKVAKDDVIIQQVNHPLHGAHVLIKSSEYFRQCDEKNKLLVEVEKMRISVREIEAQYLQIMNEHQIINFIQ